MKAHIIACLTLLIGSAFGAQIGDSRDAVEKEYGEPFLRRTRQVATRSFEVARYADRERVTVSVYYVKDTCVAMRLTCQGEISGEEVISLLGPFSVDGKPWVLLSRDSENLLENNSYGKDRNRYAYGKDEIERYGCSRLRNKRLAVVTRTTEMVRGATETKNWNVLIFSDEEREVIEAIQKERI